MSNYKKIYKKSKNKLLPLIKRIYKKYPNLIQTMANRHLMYNQELEYVQSQIQNGNTFVLDEGRLNDFLQSSPIFNFCCISNIQTYNEILNKLNATPVIICREYILQNVLESCFLSSLALAISLQP